MDITEVARRSGLPASTLRFYEEKGLIASIGRRGLHRVFDPNVLERLALNRTGTFRRLLARRDRAHVRPRRAALHQPAHASSESGRAGQDYPQTNRDAGRPTARRCLPGSESHGMSHVSPYAAGCRVWSFPTTKEKALTAV